MQFSRRSLLQATLAGVATEGLLACRAMSAPDPATRAPAGSSPPKSDVVMIDGGVPRPLPTAFDRPGVTASALAAAQAVSDACGGSALLVCRDGRLVYERYSPGFSAESRLKTYSMAKSVLGLVYGIAVAQGVVSLDDPISLHVEEWRGDPRGAITLRQLLQMRSGLKLYSLALGTPEALNLVFGKSITGPALRTPLVVAPGSEFEYNNVDAFLAGVALDRALTRSGRGRYAEFLSRELWAPIGQTQASLEVDGPDGTPRFFAGFDATARDWLRLGQLFVDAGQVEGRQVVPADWIGAMTTPSPNPAYGLLIWRASPWVPLRAYSPHTPSRVPCKEPILADDMVFFDGAGGQRVYASASLKLVIVRTGAQSLAWDDSALPNAVIRGFT